MINEVPMILVLGGTGHYGQHVVKSLVAHGAHVRVLSRNATHARELLPKAVEVVEGSLESRESVKEALKDVDRLVISISAFNRRQVSYMQAIEKDAVLAALNEAKNAGINRIVYLSVLDLREEIVERFHLDSARIKMEVEAILKFSSFNWTVIAAPPSMELFFAMIRGDRMVVPGGGPKAIPTISPVDLGEIAAQATLRDDLGGRRIRVAGPDLLSFREAALRLSAVYGRPIRFMAIPLLLPQIAWVLSMPFIRLARAVNFVNTMLAYILLLNAFPQDIAASALRDYENLKDVFHYTPTTLEMEAQRRMAARGTGE